MIFSARPNGKTVLKFLEVLFLLFNVILFLGIAKKVLWSHPSSETAFFGFLSAKKEKQTPLKINILCMGTDSVEGTHRTDTLLLVGIDHQEKKINIVSIPRDTKVIVGSDSRKINEVFAKYGPEMVRTLVEELMDVRINRYIKVDFQGFINIMDLIGGIDLLIEHPMHYDDNWGNLHIHFASGPTHLDGKKALDYVRFRADPNADLGRIKRQQRFVAAVIEKISQPSIVFKIPEILREAYKNIQTDFPLQETFELAYLLKEKGFKVQTESLPGEGKYIDKISYFVPNEHEAKALGAKWFSNFSHFGIEASFTVPIASENKP